MWKESLEPARIDCPAACLHALGDVRPFERRARCRRTADELAIGNERHLAVGAQVSEKNAPMRNLGRRAVAQVHKGVQPARDDACGNVAAHVPRNARAQVRLTHARDRTLVAEQRLRLERVRADAFRRDPAQNVLHHRVASNRPTRNARRINTRLRAQIARELADAAHRGVFKNIERSRSTRLDAADHISAKRRLRVRNTSARQQLACCCIKQISGDSGGAQIDGNAKLTSRGGIAREPRKRSGIGIGAFHPQSILVRNGDNEHAVFCIRLACERALPFAIRAFDLHGALAAGAVAPAWSQHGRTCALQNRKEAFAFHGGNGKEILRLPGRTFRPGAMRIFKNEHFHEGSSLRLVACCAFRTRRRFRRHPTAQFGQGIMFGSYFITS